MRSNLVLKPKYERQILQQSLRNYFLRFKRTHITQEKGNLTMVARRSSGLQRSPKAASPQKSWENHPDTCFTRENRRQTSRESSVDSHTGDQKRDIVTGANLTPLMVAECLVGRSMQSREPLQRQDSINDASQDTVPPVLETTNQTTPSDPINCLAEVLVGMHNRPSA